MSFWALRRSGSIQAVPSSFAVWLSLPLFPWSCFPSRPPFCEGSSRLRGRCPRLSSKFSSVLVSYCYSFLLVVLPCVVIRVRVFLSMGRHHLTLCICNLLISFSSLQTCCATPSGSLSVIALLSFTKACAVVNMNARGSTFAQLQHTDAPSWYPSGGSHPRSTRNAQCLFQGTITTPW